MVYYETKQDIPGNNDRPPNTKNKSSAKQSSGRVRHDGQTEQCKCSKYRAPNHWITWIHHDHEGHDDNGARKKEPNQTVLCYES